MLDAGDCWGDTMIADRTKGSALVAALNHLDYDAMTVGNHEPDFGRESMSTLIAQARFPVVAANLVVGPDGLLFSKGYVVREIGGVRVGVLGLETFIYWQGRMGRQFADALIERARAKVKVPVLLAWLGTKKMDLDSIQSMKDAGVEVQRYHPLRWYTIRWEK